MWEEWHGYALEKWFRLRVFCIAFLIFELPHCYLLLTEVISCRNEDFYQFIIIHIWLSSFLVCVLFNPLVYLHWPMHFCVLKKSISADTVHGFIPEKEEYLLLLFNAGRQVVFSFSLRICKCLGDVMKKSYWFCLYLYNPLNAVWCLGRKIFGDWKL